jgi:hypothetical protein
LGFFADVCRRGERVGGRGAARASRAGQPRRMRVSREDDTRVSRVDARASSGVRARRGSRGSGAGPIAGNLNPIGTRTVRVFIFSIISSVAADMATTPERRTALGAKAEALSALTGAPYAT